MARILAIVRKMNRVIEIVSKDKKGLEGRLPISIIVANFIISL